MEILEDAGVGPCARRLIKSFSENETLVCRASGYYGRAFKSDRGVTQGGPLSPTIFNLMVDAIVREWIYQMVATGFDTTDIRVIAAVFYADDGLIATRDPAVLQDAFDLLTDLFDRVGLATNETKTEVMVFLPDRIRTCLSEDAYLSRMDTLHRASKKAGKVECHICQKKFGRLCLASHLASQHGVYHSHLLVGADVCQPAAEPRRLTAKHYINEDVWRCPVPDCPMGREGKGAASQQALRLHFSHRHPNYLVVTAGNCFPRCRRCRVQTRAAGTPRHEATATCHSRAERRDQHAVAARCAAAVEQTFTAMGKPLCRVETFKYLGRVIAYDDSDVPAARRQLQRARAVWGRLRNGIAKEGVPAPVAGMFYQAVVAAVLLYGSESWVLPQAQLARLEGFHVECARRLTGMRPRKVGKKWVYPKSAAVLAKAGLKPLSFYIQKRWATVAATIADRPVLEECRGAARLRGTPVR